MTEFTTLYNFLCGPFLWLTLIVFIGGSVYKIATMISLVNKKEKFIYTHISLKYSLRSIFHWIIPFATLNWRRHPVVTVLTFLFHGGLVIMPFFLSAHVIMFNKAWGIKWWTLPYGFVDVVTLIVISSCIIFLVRRLTLREVRFLTTPSDYLILVIACAPFLSGFLALHQIGDYHFWLILHILTGELMLMAIPFTRLSHMLFGVFTRAYSGSEFGGIRHARDW